LVGRTLFFAKPHYIFLDVAGDKTRREWSKGADIKYYVTFFKNFLKKNHWHTTWRLCYGCS
jgi:hypothetical protein